MLAHSIGEGRAAAVLASNPESDRELAARFEREVTPLRKRLSSRAFRLTGNQQDAEDLVQDTILQAYKGFRTFRHGTDLMPWLYRIMHNTWINHWRKRQRRVAEVPAGCITDQQLSEWAAHRPSESRSAELAALDSVPDSDIQAALSKLHVDMRLTVYYADVEGFSRGEIADMMNAPIGTVLSRLHRGRRRLRTSLAAVASQRGYRPNGSRDDPAPVTT